MDGELLEQVELYGLLIRSWYAKGYCPATSSNFSFKFKEHFLISRSGVDKQYFEKKDFLICNLNGEVLESFYEHSKPSAETILHLGLYRKYPKIGCVIHTHSINAILLAERFEESLLFKDQEILKAFSQKMTHDTELSIPIVENSQDLQTINEKIIPRLDDSIPAYIIRRHGIYIWGESILEAKKHLEALEYMFEYNLKRVTNDLFI